MIETTGVLKGVIQEVREKVEFSQIVDLGSGSGGPMIDVVQQLNASENVTSQIDLLLTDKYPNHKFIDLINGRSIPNVRYSKKPVDARDISQMPAGLKTMIASFHHMKPKVAKQILQSAEESKEPILIYEIAENNVPVILWVLLLPISLMILILMVIFMTPFVKPLRLSQIVFTYIIPIIPIVYAWDGQASIMRTYTKNDVLSLINESEDSSYQWEVASAKKKNGKQAGYYIFGWNDMS